MLILSMLGPSAVISALAPETAANIFEDGKLKNSANPTADRAQMIEDYKKKTELLRSRLLQAVTLIM